MSKSEIDIQSLQLTKSASLSDAIKVIDEGHVQIALVIDENQRLIGTITDGDIRRALIRGESLDSPVEIIMFCNFRALPIDTTKEEALALMRRETLHQIPELDEQGRVVRLFLLEESKSSRHHGRWRGQAFASTYAGLSQADAACWRKTITRNHSGAVH